MNTQHTCSQERFLRDISTHEMTVVQDNGTHRHLKFKKPDSSTYWFSLITWPGALCIDGDMGTYVFRRLPDMFEFFRTDREYAERKGLKLFINPGYWGEKLQSMPAKGFKEFDKQKFDRAIYEYLVGWIRSHRHDTRKDERRELWDEVKNCVWQADGEDRKRTSAYDFHHTVNRQLYFKFYDFWEINVERYTHQFIWCCYAIAWGIEQYDLSKQAATRAEGLAA